MNIKQEFTREECYNILQQYDKECYDYYMKNAWYFGMGARRYAKHLYIENLVLNLFKKYFIKFERIYKSDTFRAYVNGNDFSTVRIEDCGISLDGKLVDEEDFEIWCGKI